MARASEAHAVILSQTLDRENYLLKELVLQYTITIGKSLKALLYGEKANTDKMLASFCGGIIGLTLAASKRRDLVTRGAKDDLSKFVVKEMERVRKQQGLRKSDVYKEEFLETD